MLMAMAMLMGETDGRRSFDCLINYLDEWALYWGALLGLDGMFLGIFASLGDLAMAFVFCELGGLYDIPLPSISQFLNLFLDNLLCDTRVWSIDCAVPCR